MTSSHRNQTAMAGASLLVGVLSAANWRLRPEAGALWLIGLAAVLLFWLAICIAERRRGRQTASELALLWWSGIAAGLIVAVALGLKLATSVGLAGGEMRERIFGVVMGLFLVGMGNAVPKVVGPLTARRCAAWEAQAVQRFTGWTFVIGGLGYIAAWLALPNDAAQVVSMSACAAAVLLVLARVGWALSRPQKSA